AERPLAERSRQQPVHRAPDLERPGDLGVLELEEHLRAPGLAQRRRVVERSLSHPGTDPLIGRRHLAGQAMQQLPRIGHCVTRVKPMPRTRPAFTVNPVSTPFLSRMKLKFVEPAEKRSTATARAVMFGRSRTSTRSPLPSGTSRQVAPS